MTPPKKPKDKSLKTAPSNTDEKKKDKQSAKSKTQRSPALKNLETLSLFISTPMRSAFAAAYVLYYAKLYFYQYPEDERRKRFRMHPANTLAYRALDSLEDSSIVSIVETMKDELSLHPHSENLRRIGDLIFHRHSISHPASVQWTKPAMQDFYDSARHHTDLRIALVWDLKRSINESLKKHGLRIIDVDIPAYPQMASLLHQILSYAASNSSYVPPENELLSVLSENVTKFQDLLEKYPDGARDLDAESERRERARDLVERATTEVTRSL